MKKKVIFFDFDYTLGNRDVYAYSVFRKLIEQYAHTQDSFEIEAMVQNCMIFDQRGDCDKRYIVDQLNRLYGLGIQYSDFEKLWANSLWENAEVYSDAKETLSTLKQRGYRLAVITNGPSAGQRGKLKQSGILDCFEAVMISEEVGSRKPDSKIFMEALKHMNVSAGEAVMVGDMFARDILGAYRVGMDAIWVSTIEYTPCTVDIPRVHRIGEILKYFD